jgi:hypothetical protein
MAMGRREKQRRQEELWTAHRESPGTAAHPFYEQLNRLLEARDFDEWAKQERAGRRIHRRCGAFWMWD